MVCVQATGEARTRRGQPYNNTYCFVFRLRGEKIETVDIEQACGQVKLVSPFCDLVESARAVGREACGHRGAAHQHSPRRGLLQRPHRG